MDPDPAAIVLIAFLIGTGIILILVMVILWRYIRSLTLKTIVKDKTLSAHAPQSPAQLHESGVMLTEEGLYCVTSTPHVNRSHSYTSDSSVSSPHVTRTHSDTSDSSETSRSSNGCRDSDTQSVRTICRHLMLDSTYVINQVETETEIGYNGTKEEESMQETLTVSHCELRPGEPCQNESTYLPEDEKKVKEITLIINEEEENLYEENNNFEEYDKSIVQEKYLFIETTITDSLVNVSFA